MDPILSLIASLEQAAENLKAARERLVLPGETQGNIVAALQRLESVLGPDAYFSIKPPDINHTSKGKVNVETWSVYLPTGICGVQGGEFYKGRTLDAAVQAAIDALPGNKREATAAEVQAALLPSAAGTVDATTGEVVPF